MLQSTEFVGSSSVTPHSTTVLSLSADDPIAMEFANDHLRLDRNGNCTAGTVVVSGSSAARTWHVPLPMPPRADMLESMQTFESGVASWLPS